MNEYEASILSFELSDESTQASTIAKESEVWAHRRGRKGGAEDPGQLSAPQLSA